MRDQNNHESPIDALLLKTLDEPVPAEVERRLRGRLAEFRERLAARPSGTPSAWFSIFAARRLALAAGVAVAASLVIGLFWWTIRPASAWADVAQAVQSQPWLHAIGHGPAGDTLEIWFSPRFGVTATHEGRTLAFFDRSLGVYDSYSPSLPDPLNPTIIRMSLDDYTQKRLAESSTVLTRLFTSEPKRTVSFESMTLRHDGEKRATEGDKSWFEHRFTVLGSDGGEGSQMVLRVDPATRLPFWWQWVSHAEGKESVAFELDVDYPATGPTSIYALGVPQTATLIDRTQPGDERQLVAGLEAGRQRFDGYYAVVVESTASQSWSEAMLVHRVWRDGSRWRVERGYGRFNNFEAPGDEVNRTQWWLQNASERAFLPVELCDGRQHWEFKRTSSGQPHPQQPDVILIESLERKLIAGDLPERRRPISKMELPEFQTHPFVNDVPPRYEFKVDPKPSSGPEETLLLEVRPTRLAAGEIFYRYWIAPKRGYMVMRHEVLKSDGAAETIESAWVIEKAELSPQGHSHPTDVRVINGGINPDGTREDYHVRYYLDFGAEVPDRLFDADQRRLIIEHSRNLVDESAIRLGND